MLVIVNGCVLQANNITINPNNSIYDNYSYAVYNGTHDTGQEGGIKTLDAQYNWWGDASGPYNATTNPFGYGDIVDANVTYTHYRATAP